MRLFPLLAAAGLLSPVTALADAPVETFVQGGTTITLHLHPFLNDEEVTILRVVGENPDALSVFVGAAGGFGAMAIAPEEGFVRDGIPVDSAAAVAALPDLDQARAAALTQCNAARQGGSGCVVVLEIAPQ